MSHTLLLSLFAAHAAVVPADLVQRTGVDFLGTNDACTDLGAAFVTASSGVSYSATFVSNDRAIMLDDTALWLNSDAAGATLTGAEASLGATDAGQFIYSPTVDGDDGVWTQAGPLAVEGDMAVGFNPGVFVFHSRPTIASTGVSYWIAGVNESGGTSTEKRALYTSIDGQLGTTSVVMAGGDALGGFTIADQGLDFDFSISSSDLHLAQVINLETGSTADDTTIVVDGVIQAREAMPTGDGDNWQNMDVIAVNDAGDFLFSGDTDAASSDEFVAFNANISLREGDVVDGVTLGSAVRSVALNNAGEAMIGWNDPNNSEHIWVSCDASNLSGAQRVLSVGDELDFNGDGVGDGTVDDLLYSTFTTQRSMADNGTFYTSVEINDAGLVYEALVQVDGGCCVDVDVDGRCEPRLSVTPPVPGDSMVLDVAGAPAGASVFILVTGRGTAPNATCHPTFPICSDLIQPTILGPFRADAIGSMRRMQRVPNGLPPGATVDLQALWFSGGVGEIGAVVSTTVR